MPRSSARRPSSTSSATGASSTMVASPVRPALSCHPSYKNMPRLVSHASRRAILLDPGCAIPRHLLADCPQRQPLISLTIAVRAGGRLLGASYGLLGDEGQGGDAMQSFDLVIRGGTVVTATDSFAADVGIRGETIAALGLGLD